MAIEPKRGCGYRKEGGLYMMGGKLNAPCCLLPVALTICPTCGEGVKQTRGWTWIEPATLLKTAEAPCQHADLILERGASICSIPLLEGRHGLIWIGKQHYKTTLEFTHEAATMGISRRINTVPNDFVLGETFVFFAHPEAVKTQVEVVTTQPGEHLQEGAGETHMEDRLVPGIFCGFRPTSIEILVKESELTDEKREQLEKRGLTPVAVPDDDPDHCVSEAA